MSDLYEPQISTALHDRVDGVSPDLASLASGAVRQGTRIRRRRTATTVAAAFAVVGAIGGTAATAALLADDAAAPREPSVLGEPWAAVPFELTGPRGWECERTEETVISCTEAGHRVDLHWIRIPDDARLADGSVDWARVEALTGPQDGGLGTSPRLTWYAWLDYADKASGRAFDGRQLVVDYHEQPVPQDLAFTIEVPAGWECDVPGDEKFGCSKASGALVTVIQREADDHEEWATSPDKGGPGTGVRVSEVHGDHFVSIQPTTATESELDELAAALTWDDGTPVF